MAHCLADASFIAGLSKECSPSHWHETYRETRCRPPLGQFDGFRGRPHEVINWSNTRQTLELQSRVQLRSLGGGHVWRSLSLVHSRGVFKTRPDHSGLPDRWTCCDVRSPRPQAAAEAPCPVEAGDARREAEETRQQQDGALLRAAGIVGMAATASKLLGLVRETVLAAAFGVGPVMTAFSYASFIPTFCLSLLGGVNGPFHSAITAALSKRSQEEGRALVDRVSLLLALVFAVFTVAVMAFASSIIDLSAPGLLAGGTAEGFATRAIAIAQLRLMSPCVLLAALIGVGFGSLSALQVYALPSLSPSLSSLAVLLAVALHLLRTGPGPSTPETLSAGGLALAGGMTAGAFAQWASQAAAQGWGSSGLPQLLSGDLFHDEGLREVLRVMVPATVGSGMLQIATYTDLFFASFLPGTAAALGYANLLVMAPLGILSSALLVPILPLFARLSKPEQKDELKERIRQALIIAAAVTLPMTATMVPLASPMVKVLLQRHSFDAAATALVSSLLVCYVVGATAYLARDVLVRVFYALGDGQTPFNVSLAAIGTNACLDWLLVRRLGFGPRGLVLATLSVNTLSALALWILLSRRLGGLGYEEWVQPASVLLKAAALSSASTCLAFSVASSWTARLSHLTLNARVLWAAEAAAVGCAGVTGVAVFATALVVLRLAGAESSWRRFRRAPLRAERDEVS